MENKKLIITGNNGMGHTKNPASYYRDCFYHRTSTEALVTRALINKKILFAPLVAFGIGNRRKREIDHLICRNGFMLLQEIDGDSHINESMFEAERRLKPFRDQGFFIKRYRQPPYPDLEWADSICEESISFIDDMTKIFGRRG